MSPGSFSIRQALRFGWRATRRNPGLLLGAALVTVVVALTLRHPPGWLGALGLPIEVLAVAALLALGIGWIRTAVKLLEYGERPSLMDLFSVDSPTFFGLLAASVLAGSAVLIPLASSRLLLSTALRIEESVAQPAFLAVALSAWALFISVRLVLFPFFVVDREAGPVEALGLSWRATTAHFWRLLAFAAVLATPYGLWGVYSDLSPAEWLTTIALGLAMPVCVLAATHAYRGLSGGLEPPAKPAVTALHAQGNSSFGLDPGDDEIDGILKVEFEDRGGDLWMEIRVEETSVWVDLTSIYDFRTALLDWIARICQGRLPVHLYIDQDGWDAHLDALPTSEDEVMLRVPGHSPAGDPILLARLQRRELVVAFLKAFRSSAATQQADWSGYDLPRLRATLDATTTKSAFSIRQALRFAWGATRRNPGLLLGAALVAMAALLSLRYPPGILDKLDLPLPMLAVGVLLALGIGWIRIAVKLIDYGERPSLADLFSIDWPTFFGLFAASVLAGSAVIIPLASSDLLLRTALRLEKAIGQPVFLAVALSAWALFIGVRLVFFPFFVVDRQVGPVEALGLSWRASAGHFWRLLACIVSLATAYGFWGIYSDLSPAGLLATFALGIAVPVCGLTATHAYRGLAGRLETPSNPAVPAARDEGDSSFGLDPGNDDVDGILKVAFEDRGGDLWMELRVEETSTWLDLSGFFPPPVPGLVGWLARICLGRLPAHVYIDEEGYGAHLDALPTGEDEVVLRVRGDSPAGDPILLARLQRRELVVAFLKAFRSSAATQQADWSGYDLRRLRAALDATTTKSAPLQELSRPTIDSTLFSAAAEVIDGLIRGRGPIEYLFVDSDGAPVVQHFLYHLEQRPAALRLLMVANGIRQLLEDEGRLRSEVVGLSQDLRLQLLEECRSILDRPIWSRLVEAGLESDDASCFSEALTASDVLKIDAWEYCFRRAEAGQHNLLALLLTTEDPDRARRAVSLAERVLPLRQIASGPALDASPAGRYEDACLASVLQFLGGGLSPDSGWRGIGWPLIRTGIASPVIYVRRTALMALIAWPRATLPGEARPVLRRALDEEPDAGIKELIEQVMTLVTGGTPAWLR